MDDFYNEINKLVKEIMNYKITKVQAAECINDLKNKYGGDVFPDIYFEKKEKPWDEQYLQKLKRMNITGACSEQFLLHMAEVSEEIASRKKKFIIKIFIGLVAAVVIVVLIIRWIYGVI